jgi:hypothetical protein
LSSSQVDFYDGELHVRTLHTPNAATALAFLPSSAGSAQLLALAELSCVSVWDVRCKPCALRFAAASGAGPACALLALAAAAGPSAAAPLLAAAGEERALTVFDCRSGRQLRRHTGVMRKEVTHTRFSAADPRWLYMAGADNEVRCRRWDALACDEGGGGGWAFRGEARWAGLDVAASGGGDCLAAWTAKGTLCAAMVDR